MYKVDGVSVECRHCGFPYYSDGCTFCNTVLWKSLDGKKSKKVVLRDGRVFVAPVGFYAIEPYMLGGCY